jgi:hypothetical protein
MRRIAIGTLAALLAFHVLVRASADDLVDRFLSSTGPPLTSYRAFRTLEADARGGHTHARLTAWTTLDPVQGFRYSVVEESGSGIVRQKVLHAALEAEQTMRVSGELDKGALTPLNYEFSPGRDAEDGLIRVGIHPKRHDTMLVEGSILLTEADGDLTRVEGFLIKRPSFWTREVQVVRKYERICGIRVPVSMQSIARVLIAGRSTFSMTYEYASINGMAVTK